MANIIKRIGTQINEDYNTPKRFIVQYFDDASPETETQQIINYDDLDAGEKATFDAYQSLCESKMI